jgi:hypothetical protein
MQDRLQQVFLPIRNTTSSLVVVVTDRLNVELTAPRIEQYLSNVPPESLTRNKEEHVRGPSFPVLVRNLIGVSTLGIASIGISVAIVKSALLPQQVSWVAAAGAVVVAIATVITYQTRKITQRRLPKQLSAAILASFVALVALQSTLVVEININKIPTRFLVGWRLNTWASSALKNCDQSLHPSGAIDPSAVFTCAGPDMIPLAYGWTYRVVYISYALSYLALAASFSALISLNLLGQGNHRRNASL